MKTLKQEFDKKSIITLLKQICLILIGTFIMAFGYIVFLAPHNIVPGGFMGLAQIVHDVLSKIGFTFISTSVWYLILNIFLYLYAVSVLGLKFGIRSGVGIFSYSFFSGLIEKLSFVQSITNQFQAESETLGSVYILYALYGGLIMGIGMGFVFRGEGSTGGCDMVAVVVNRIKPTITTGQIVITVDGIVVLLSAFAYSSLVLPLYALITIFICGKVSDIFVDGVKSLNAYYILTDKRDELSSAILKNLKHGLTYIKCEGMFTHQEKSMLFIVLKRTEVIQLRNIVKEVDPKAFMYGHPVKDAYGNGFLPYEPQKLESNLKLFSKNKLFKDKTFLKVNKDNQNQEELKTEISKNKTLKLENGNLEVIKKSQTPDAESGTKIEKENEKEDNNENI